MTLVFGAAEIRKFCGFHDRKGMAYWRDPARGEDRFPEPSQTLSIGEVWDPRVVTAWAERTKERRGMVWTRDGLRLKPCECGTCPKCRNRARMRRARAKANEGEA